MMSEYHGPEPERPPQPKRTLVEWLKHEWYIMTYPEQGDLILLGLVLVVILVVAFMSL